MDIVRKSIVALSILSLAFIFGCAKKDEPAAEIEETAADETEILTAQELTPKEELGRRLFFDTRLSEPMGQACAVCHGPTVGWTGPDEALNKAGSVYPGALEPRFGNRKPPTSAYAGASPELHRDDEGTFVGGMFWNGRATGWTLGDPLAEQAMGPFLNPLEQNNPDNKAIIQKVIDSDYADLFREVWGADSLYIEDPEAIYAKIGRSIAAYERSGDMTKFTSKFDDFWRKAAKAGLDVAAVDAGNKDRFQNLGLNEAELQGLVLFNTTGLCAQCHVLDSIDGNPPLFTDFTYDNLGVPRNPDNPFYAMGKEWNLDGENWVDKGLGGFLETTEEYKQYARENIGKQKVPTLRNVDLRPYDGFVKAFTHNGFFKSLKEVVNFYNTRDKEGSSWPPPEIAENVNVDEMGNLGLTPEEEDLIVLFMTTLSDR